MTFGSSDVERALYIMAAILHVHEKKNELPTRGTVHEYDTRSVDLLNIPRHRLSTTQRTATYTAIKIYNGLPTQMKELTSKCLKIKLKQILLDSAPYTIEEFTDMF